MRGRFDLRWILPSSVVRWGDRQGILRFSRAVDVGVSSMEDWDPVMKVEEAADKDSRARGCLMLPSVAHVHGAQKASMRG
jgi:hypothetical protein